MNVVYRDPLVITYFNFVTLNYQKILWSDGCVFTPQPRPQGLRVFHRGCLLLISVLILVSAWKLEPIYSFMYVSNCFII